MIETRHNNQGQPRSINVEHGIRVDFSFNYFHRMERFSPPPWFYSICIKIDKYSTHAYNVYTIYWGIKNTQKKPRKITPVRKIPQRWAQMVGLSKYPLFLYTHPYCCPHRLYRQTQGFPHQSHS